MEVDIDYIAIGKRIRSARLAKKMTQETLSNMIDVTPTYISTIENGHTKLSLSTLLSIAQILDTTVDQLLYDNTPVLISQFDADIKELPIRRRISDCRAASAAPNSSSLPRVGRVRPHKIRSRVVFPAPFSPIRP